MAAWRNGNPTHVKPHIRKKILTRDNHTCQRCGGVGVEVDHINNTRGPGYDDLDNLQALCVSCHKAKTQREAQAGRAARVARVKRPPTPSFCDIPHTSRFDTDRG